MVGDPKDNSDYDRPNSLKKYIFKNLIDSEDPQGDIQDLTRSWLCRQNFLDIVVRAINGEEIEGEKLKLKDRIAFALKLSNKIIPDIKSIVTKGSVDHNINMPVSATQQLLIDAGIVVEVIEEAEEVEEADEAEEVEEA